MTTIPSAARWREQLAAWALPEELLASVDRSPYSWPAGAFARMAQVRPDPVTGPLVRSLLGDEGTLLDVGAGAGRLSLPIATAGHRVTAVEPNESMAEQLEKLATEAATPISVIRGRWPDAAVVAGPHDVALTANVVYDVADVVPFIEALHRSATRAVVVELTRRHPWDGLRRYFRELHYVRLPDGPTVEDLVAVVRGVVGVEPQRHDWLSPSSLPFESQQALLDLYQTRLCVPDGRRAELDDLLAGDIEETDDGLFVLRTGAGGMTTLWWSTAEAVALG